MVGEFWKNWERPDPYGPHPCLRLAYTSNALTSSFPQFHIPISYLATSREFYDNLAGMTSPGARTPWAFP